MSNNEFQSVRRSIGEEARGHCDYIASACKALLVALAVFIVCTIGISTLALTGSITHAAVASGIVAGVALLFYSAFQALY